MLIKLIPILLMLFSSGSAAEPLDLEGATARFVIVTHKGGIGSALAHNHVIGTNKVAATIDADLGKIESTRFEATLQANDLIVDEANFTNSVYELIARKRVLKEKPGDVSDGDRKDIRETMLGDTQLDAAKHPQIKAALQKLVPAPPGKPDTTHLATVALTIKGKTIAKDFFAQITPAGDSVKVVAWGAATFTEFGIEPVSLFFGAIRNQDNFDLLVEFTANKPKAS